MRSIVAITSRDMNSETVPMAVESPGHGDIAKVQPDDSINTLIPELLGFLLFNI
jgi:hypothetical protein